MERLTQRLPRDIRCLLVDMLDPCGTTLFMLTYLEEFQGLDIYEYPGLAFGNALENGYISCLEFIEKEKKIISMQERPKNLYWNAMKGGVKVCEWLWSKGIVPLQYYVTEFVMKNENTEILDWARTHTKYDMTYILQEACEHGSVKILEYCYQKLKRHELTYVEGIKQAIRRGCIVSLEWALEKKVFDPQGIFASDYVVAAISGRCLLSTMWLKEHGANMSFYCRGLFFQDKCLSYVITGKVVISGIEVTTFREAKELLDSMKTCR